MVYDESKEGNLEWSRHSIVDNFQRELSSFTFIVFNDDDDDRAILPIIFLLYSFSSMAHTTKKNGESRVITLVNVLS